MIMKTKVLTKSLLAVFALVGSLWSQAGRATNSTVSYRLASGASLPSTCNPGPAATDVFIDTAGTATAYFCSATNTWSAVGTTGGGVASFNTRTGAVVFSASDYSGAVYGTAGGTANAQTVTTSPAVGSLTAGLTILWTPAAANTTSTPTLAVSGLTAKTIIKVGGGALAASDLTTTAIATAIYDGTAWELQNPQTGSGSGNVSTSSNLTSGTPACGTAATTIANCTVSGTGGVVLATGATLVTPALGTPASGVITNLTGTCTSCNAATATACATANGCAAGPWFWSTYGSGVAIASNQQIIGYWVAPQAITVTQEGYFVTGGLTGCSTYPSIGLYELSPAGGNYSTIRMISTATAAYVSATPSSNVGNVFPAGTAFLVYTDEASDVAGCTDTTTSINFWIQFHF